MKKQHFVWVVALCALGSFSSSVFADLTITDIGGPGGTGTIDNGGPNTATLEKTFTSLGDIPFTVHRNPQTGTDTLVVSERVRNNTGVAWTDFHFVMEPIDANPLLKVQFLNVSNPTSQWTSQQTGDNFLSLFGLVPNGDIFSLTFTLQVTSATGSFDLFRIHEFPTVPSPSASVLAMLGCSILCLISRSRGRRGLS